MRLLLRSKKKETSTHDSAARAGVHGTPSGVAQVQPLSLIPVMACCVGRRMFFKDGDEGCLRLRKDACDTVLEAM